MIQYPGLGGSAMLGEEEIYHFSIDSVIFFLVGGILMLISSLVLVIVFIKYRKDLLKQPGDLIFGLCVSQFILSIQWIVWAFYLYKHRDGGVSTGDFQYQVQLWIGSFGIIITQMYATAFIFYALLSVRFTLRGIQISRTTFHFFTFILTVAYFIFALLSDDLGFFFGKIPKAKFLGEIPAIFVVVIVLMALYTSWYINNRSQVLTELNGPRRSQFVAFYKRFINITLLAWILTFLCNAMAYFFEDLRSVFSDARTTCNIIYIVLLARQQWKEPMITKRLKSMLSREPLLPEVADNERASGGSSSAVFKSSRILEQSALMIQQINESLKNAIAFSVLYGIRAYYLMNFNEYQHPGDSAFMPELDVNQETMQENDVLREEMQLLSSHKGFSFRNSKVVSYSPNKFGTILLNTKTTSARESIKNFIGSLDLNLNAIKSSGKQDGGRSGEFFFFSHDNQVIIKTITPKEAENLLNILQQQLEYFEKNPRSLLARFFGLFEVSVDGMEGNRHFVVMGNINQGTPSSSILRTYDLKGSSIDRRVLTEDEIKAGKTNKMTVIRQVLKDTDFELLEESVNLPTQISIEFNRVLNADIEFLQEHGLIDYSLLVLKVSKNRVIERSSQYNEDRKWFPLLPSVKFSESGVLYNIGIIDYLQEYDFGKKMEKWIKIAKTCNRAIDVSVTDPSSYKQRFQRLLGRLPGVTDASTPI